MVELQGVRKVVQVALKQPYNTTKAPSQLGASAGRLGRHRWPRVPLRICSRVYSFEKCSQGPNNILCEILFRTVSRAKIILVQGDMIEK